VDSTPAASSRVRCARIEKIPMCTGARSITHRDDVMSHPRIKRLHRPVQSAPARRAPRRGRTVLSISGWLDGGYPTRRSSATARSLRRTAA
jgi:hypothetical protein